VAGAHTVTAFTCAGALRTVTAAAASTAATSTAAAAAAAVPAVEVGITADGLCTTEARQSRLPLHVTLCTALLEITAARRVVECIWGRMVVMTGMGVEWWCVLW
jgi:hypothetical protein